MGSDRMIKSGSNLKFRENYFKIFYKKRYNV